MNHKQYSLMIVEAPPKAKKIKEILRKENMNFEVVATRGYLVDLPLKEYGLKFNADNDVEIQWRFLEGKQKLLTEIKVLAQHADKIYIATDGDREGEKIAKDIKERLKLTDYYRIIFNSIEKDEIIDAINNPTLLDTEKVEVAITRRVIDRDIGFPVSQILRYDLKKEEGVIFPSNVGCGRSISPSLHILNENQKKIDEFEEEEYKRLKVWYLREGVAFEGLHKTRFMVESRENMLQLEMVKEQMYSNMHTVARYTPKDVEVAPPEPMYTAILQQSASNLFGFKGSYTMKMAQLLYRLGYITYHRTDSNFVSAKAHLKIVDYLMQHFEEDDVLETKRKYKKRKNSQEGHEAIRPVYFTDEFHPDNIKKVWVEKNEFEVPNINNQKQNFNKLTNDHIKIYEIIWYRALATQMRNAVYDRSEVVIDIEGNEIELKANTLRAIDLYDGGTKLMKGWLQLKQALLQKSTLVENEEFKNKEVRLPIFNEGERLKFTEITEVTSWTRPPYVYGEGRFIRKIDSEGIARPSTLASIIPSLEEKKCVKYVGATIRITRLGQRVDDWVSNKAPWLNDLEQCKLFEDTLDELANGNFEEYSTNSLIMEYHEKIELLKEEVGYLEFDDRKPLDWQIDTALKIAKDKNIKLGEEVLKTRASIDFFIQNNKIKTNTESLGKCPACKKGEIRENSSAFSCSDWKNGCKFAVWKKSAMKFFEIFHVTITDNYLKNIIIGALRNKPLLYQGFTNKKNENFDAYVIIEKQENYNAWQLALKKYEKKNIKVLPENKTNDLEIMSEKNKRLEKVQFLPNYKNFTDAVTKSFNIQGCESISVSVNCINGLGLLDEGLVQSTFETMIENATTRLNGKCFLNYTEEKYYFFSFARNEQEFRDANTELVNIFKSKTNTNMFQIRTVMAFRRNANTPEELLLTLSENIKNITNTNEILIAVGEYK